ELDELRKFSDSVVESLSDGLVVVDLNDRVLRWNRRVEAITGMSRQQGEGRPLTEIFALPFVEMLSAARREPPAGAPRYRVPLTPATAGQPASRFLNVGVSPFQTS